MKMRLTRKNQFVALMLLLFLAGVQITALGQNMSPTYDSRYSTPLESSSELQNIYESQIEPIRSTNATVTILINQYTFPYGISPDGNHVVVSGFGESGGFYWSPVTGITAIPGSVNGISANGLVTGTYGNPDILHNGNPVNTAGTWSYSSNAWTFLGMNPAAPNITIPDYNSGWGIDDAGTTVAGMQYVNGYVTYKAYSWTQSGGYNMIGNQHPLGSRASGISRDGSLVYGWVQPPTTSRSPAVWKNGQLHYVSENNPGEAYAASPNGTYAAGELGTNAFIWSLANGTEMVNNTLNPGRISPTIIMEDKTMFGFTNEAWPPFPDSRRAFARYSDGTMVTFNDYAEARGLENAQGWIFYSVNAVTPDENKFVGAGITPQGQIISFLLEFASDAPTIEIMPESLTEEINEGESATQPLVISNTGTATLVFNTQIEYQTIGGWLSLNPSSGFIAQGSQTTVNVTFDASSLEAGTYNAQILFNSNDPENPQIVVQVELTVNEICASPLNLEADVDPENPNQIMLAWEHPSNSRAFVGYNIYKNGELIEALWQDNTYSYIEMQISLHCFEVTAEYSICGESDPSNEACADIQVSTSELFSQNQIRIFPNPASDLLHIELESSAIIRIYNAIGQLVFEATAYANETTILQINNLQHGVYYLNSLGVDGRLFSEKVIINR